MLHGDETVHEDAARVSPELETLARIAGKHAGNVMDGDTVGDDVLKVVIVEVEAVAQVVVVARVGVEGFLAEAAVSRVVGSHSV